MVVDIFDLVVCFAVSSFFGILSLLTVIFLSERKQKKIMEVIDEGRKANAVSISGKGNTYNEKGPTG